MKLNQAFARVTLIHSAIYDDDELCEKQIQKALPKIIGADSNNRDIVLIALQFTFERQLIAFKNTHGGDAFDLEPSCKYTNVLTATV